jgi:hypothetical protein
MTIMGTDNGEKRDVRHRIASFIQAEIAAPREQSKKKEDLRELRQLAGRLDRLLTKSKDEPRPKQFTNEERVKLRNAAGKLDQLLAVERRDRTAD